MASLTRRQWLTIGLIVLFIAGWLVLYFLVTPDELVRRLGVENAYLVVLALSVIGALGSMTTFSSYPAIVTFAAGGLHFILLGVVSAIGLTIGDAIFYSLAGEVKGLLSGRAREKARELQQWLDERPEWVIPVVTYVWVGLLPLANNILTGALALLGYRFRRILLPVFLGNATFPTGVAYLATLGIELFQ
jgi:membrane protein YqaA with SNARE-associated domain